MDFTHGILLITAVHLLAAASPGPDFIMVTQQTLIHGKKSGIFCSLGIALGLSVHITYSSLGIAALIAGSASAIWTIKMLGGSYLIYLGIKGLRSRPAPSGGQELAGTTARTSMKTIGKGFLCNVLNPKAPIYFVSLFTIVLSPDMPLQLLVVYGVWIMVLQFLWFASVATLLASPPVSRRFRACGHLLDRAIGCAMILVGIKVLMSKSS